MDSLIIKKAYRGQAQEIIDFLNAVAGESDYLTFGLNEFGLSLEEERAIISDCLDNDNSLMLVAAVDEHIISQLFVEVSPRPRLSHIGHLGLTVSKAYWRQAVGSKMLADAINWAKKKQLIKLQLQVRIDNVGAIDLYKKYGFVVEGTIRDSLNIDGHTFDELVMGLKLMDYPARF